MASEVSSACADQDRGRRVEEVERELAEAREQRIATSALLKVIGRTTFDLVPVFQTIAENAVRLCGAEHASIWRFDGQLLRVVVTHNVSSERKAFIERNPIVPGRHSAVGRASLQRSTIHIHDAQTDPELTYGSYGLQADPTRTVLVIPMLMAGELLGVIFVHRNEVLPFTASQIALIETFADQAVIAIENTRLFEAEQASKRELQESLEYQTAISDVLGGISRSPSQLQPVVDTIVQTAKRLCAAERANIWRLLDGKFDLLAHTFTEPALAQYLRDNPIPADRGSLSGRAVLERRAIHLPDASADLELRVRKQIERIGSRTMLVVPLLREHEAIGALSLTKTRVEPFTDKQIELVTTFADQAVIAIENARLFEEVQARTTELTGSLEYQTAISEVLGVISRSRFELQPVIDTIVETATRLCEAERGAFLRFEEDGFRLVPTTGSRPGPISKGMLGKLIPFDRGSIAGRVAIEHSMVHVHDMQADPEITLMRDTEGDTRRTALGVPLLGVKGPIGAIVLQRTVVKPFTDRQIKLVETFADQAVIAIETARLFEQVQARTRELSDALEQQTATGDILRVIAGTPDDAQPVFDAIAQSALRLFAVSHVSIMLREGDWARCKATAGSADPRGGFLIPLERNSTSGRSMLEKTVITISDTESADSPTFARESGRVVGFRAMAAAPMMREGSAIGSIHMMRKTPGPFSNTQIELLKTFADQAVIAIENARLFDEVQLRTRELARSVQELQALGEVGRAVSSTLDLKVVLKTIVERAVALSGTDAGSIFYYRKELGIFELGETTGLSEEFVARLRKLEISARDTGPGEAIAKRQPLQIPDLTQRPSDLLRDAVLEAGFRASLMVPLLSAEGPLGALILRRRQPGEFSQAVVTLMQSFADQSAIALENARLFEEIARKSCELEIASQHKSQFVANMSHELRTPLAAILGYAELMQEGFYEPQGKKSLDALTRIRSNGKHLLGLINTVLDIAKIESGQFSLNLSEYALENVVETVRAATESLAETKKLALKADVGKRLPVGLGDEQRLTQVLLNLVGNAIKFTDTGQVRISARTANNHFAVSVTDTGPGIPVSEQMRIFEQFHQVDSSNTKAKGGTGLGLAIAKQIVEMHGGRIWVESTIGKGSTFHMHLPIRAERQLPNG
jgi:GAF domain-containing protein/anti-sigma regulatory factor (Ser/Thr protein kinase)